MKKILLIFFLMMAIVSISHAQKEKYQSLFIYNFTKYIKWPDSYNSDKFVIGVLGDSEILTSLNVMALSKKKTGNGQILEVKKYSSVDEIDECNILFVSESAIDNIGQIEAISKTKGYELIRKYWITEGNQALQTLNKVDISDIANIYKEKAKLELATTFISYLDAHEKGFN